MAHQYGDVVTLVKDGKELNAFVAQSSVQPDGEHLTLLYLDPAFNSPVLSGSALQRAVATAFAVPLKDGAKNGWKDIATDSEVEVPATETQVQAYESKIASLQGQLDAADKVIAAHTAANDSSNAELKKIAGELAKANDALTASRILRFGMGEVVVTPGKSNDQPAIVIEPAVPKSTVGADASSNAPQDVVLPGAVVLEFHGTEGAAVLLEDIAKVIAPPETPAQ